MSVAASPEGTEFFSNPIFLSAMFSLLTAQFLKAVVNIVRSKARNFRDVLVTFFWKTGGMPSSHCALAVSIATAIAFREGLETSVFILSVFFALVVIRDAMGVRRAAGLQARTLNLLGKELNVRSGIPYRPVKEVHGPQPCRGYNRQPPRFLHRPRVLYPIRLPMPASEAGPARKRAIIGGLLLAVSLALGLAALLALPPRAAPSEWRGFRPLLVETSVPEPEVIASLGEAGIKDLLCASTEPVLVSDWSGLETLTYAEAKARLVQGDPRLDTYLQRLGLWFEARAGRLAYRVLYIKEPVGLVSGATLEGRIDAGLAAIKGRYFIPEVSDAASRRGWFPFLCSALLIISACAAGPLFRKKKGSCRGIVSFWPPSMTIDRIAFRMALAAPWIVLAFGGLSPAVLSALWALAIAEVADALDLPLEEFRRGEGARLALKSLGHMRPPSLALLAVALLASVADLSILAAIGLALLGSFVAAPAYALLSFNTKARRRFIPVAIGARGAFSQRGGKTAANARAIFACTIVTAWVIFRLLAPSISPSEPSNIAFPGPSQCAAGSGPYPPRLGSALPTRMGNSCLDSPPTWSIGPSRRPCPMSGWGRADPIPSPLPASPPRSEAAQRPWESSFRRAGRRRPTVPCRRSASRVCS